MGLSDSDVTLERLSFGISMVMDGFRFFFVVVASEFASEIDDFLRFGGSVASNSGVLIEFFRPLDVFRAGCGVGGRMFELCVFNCCGICFVFFFVCLGEGGVTV